MAASDHVVIVFQDIIVHISALIFRSLSCPPKLLHIHRNINSQHLKYCNFRVTGYCGNEMS